MESNKSIRLRTTPGLSQNIQVKIEQDFDTIDFLSLKITQEEAYRNFCSDYGVVAGRVIANDGFGVENAKISIFVPLSDDDAERIEITTLYPYTAPNQTNAQGIRYNLLPRNGKRFYVYQKIPVPYSPQDLDYGYTPLGTFVGPWENYTQLGGVPEETPGYNTWRRLVDANHGPRVPVGTLPSKTDILDNDILLEVYDKYYKLSTRTNASGDYMIFGVPTGTRIVHMDVDLSDAGQSSLTPDDFINLGFSPNLFDGNNFKSATNLDSLPQLESRDISVDVIPFWGNLDQCEIGITRLDFNLNKVISPSAYLIGSAFTNIEGGVKRLGNGVVIHDATENNFSKLSNMTPLDVSVRAIPGNSNESEIVKSFSDGVIFMALPLYNRRKITNEFGDYEDSPDGVKGIPTGGDYKLEYWGTETHVQTAEEVSGQYCTANLGRDKFDWSSVTVRYDLQKRKRLFYTFGQRNTGEKKTKIITEPNYAANNNPGPWTGTDFSGKRTWAADQTNSVWFGSLYFPRIFVQNDGDTPNLIGFNEEDSNILGRGLVYKYEHLAVFRYLEITDVLTILRNHELDPDAFFINDSDGNPKGIDLKDSTTSSGAGILNTETFNMLTNSGFPFFTTNSQRPAINYQQSSDFFDYWTQPDNETSRYTRRYQYNFYFGLNANNSPLKRALEL